MHSTAVTPIAFARLARARLPAHVIARADPDDVVQSVFRAFFDECASRTLPGARRQTLWHLLVVVTVNKVRSLHAHHAAARRDARLTIAWDPADVDPEPPGRRPHGAGRPRRAGAPAGHRSVRRSSFGSKATRWLKSRAGPAGRSGRWNGRCRRPAHHLTELIGPSPV